MQKNNFQRYATLPLWQCSKCQAINTKLTNACDTCTAPYDVSYGYRLSKLVAGYNDSLFITMNGDVWGVDEHILQNKYIVDAAVGFGYKLFLTVGGRIIKSGSGGIHIYDLNNLLKRSEKFVAVAAGSFHTVALTDQGNVVARGNNNYSQLSIDGLHEIASISAGDFHTLALNVHGEVTAWGDDRQAKSAVPPTAKSDVIAIAAGTNHSLALKVDGTVVAWGDNKHGQCNVPSHAMNIQQIAAGLQYSMALTQDGRLLAWGNLNMEPMHMGVKDKPYVSIAAGGMHALAQSVDGTIVGWGNNEYKQIEFDRQDYVERYIKRMTVRPDRVQEQANAWRDRAMMVTEEIKKVISIRAERIKEKLRLEQLEVEQAQERLRQQQLEATRLKEMQDNANATLKSLCETNFLAVDTTFHEQNVLSQADLSTIKTTFLREWFKQHLPDGATQPDEDQLNAIGSVHGNVQVIARAGSGKTSTLVYRVFFLIKHCRVNANEIMMLAFNRKAANEMRERLLRLLYPKVIPEYEKYKRERRAKMRSDQIDEVAISLDALTHLRTGRDIPLPFIMTFHGLVYNVVNPSETIIYDTRDPEGAIQSKALQSLIDTHIRAQDMQGRAIRQLMSHYFRSEWIDIEDNQYNLSQAEFLAYRRSIVNLSIQGHPVKSYGEKKIADFLFTNSVAYSYEPNIVIGKVRYRPDFAIWKDKQRIVIEYVGLQGNADYDALLEQKRKAYDSQNNLEVIELTPDDIKDAHAFEQRMFAILETYNIPFRQLDDDEIWELIKDRAVGGFSRLMNGFIQKCRQLLINPVDLDKRILSHRPLTKGNLEVEFAKLARTFYQEYIDYCVDNNVIDFSTLMQRATQRIRDGKIDFSKRHSHGNITQIRFLSIDEFQDFSVLFYELLSAMRGINPTMQLFCVGDDWQAINRFAGADTRFFTDFERYIGPRTVCHITSNYRSARRIVELGNAVMQGRGVPAKAAQSLAGLIFMIYIDDFVGNDKESEYFGRYGYDLAALSRLLNVHVQNKHNVTVLSRTSAPLEDVFPKIRQLFDKSDNLKLMRSTTHGYKGLEQESIILWDVTDRQYPMLHTHWIFGRILGDTLEQIIEDERRLFYVGVTRASKTLYIVTRRQSISPFLAAAIQSITVSVSDLSVNTLPPIKSFNSGAVIVRLTGGTFSVKDAIKQHNYKWNQALTAWEKRLDVDEFSPASLARESWITQASNITVTCVDETENVLHTYHVNGGRMSKQS